MPPVRCGASIRVVLMQTHIAENRREIEWTAGLFPERQNYLDIYDHHGLIGKRAVWRMACISRRRALPLPRERHGLAHCPTSNLFLGSGLFRFRGSKDPQRPVQVGLGTDIGGGTSFSLLATMGAAYEIAQLNGRALSAVEAFYLATLGGARALALEDKIGAIAPGREADLIGARSRKRRPSWRCAMDGPNQSQISCSR